MTRTRAVTATPRIAHCLRLVPGRYGTGVSGTGRKLGAGWATATTTPTRAASGSTCERSSWSTTGRSSATRAAFTFSDADAEDLAQTAVVRALQRGTIVSDAERAKAYVKRIVRNLATDQARLRARVSIEPRAQVPDDVADDDGLDAVTEEHRDGGAAAHVAFAGLDPADREVLRLRYLDELAYRAVADRMHTTEHGARQRVYRAMQALRAAMRKQAEDDTAGADDEADDADTA